MHVGSISEKKHWNLKISLDCPPIKKSNLFFARISLVVCKSNYKTDLSPRGGVRTTSLAVFIPSDTSHPWVFSPCLLGEEEERGGGGGGGGEGDSHQNIGIMGLVWCCLYACIHTGLAGHTYCLKWADPRTYPTHLYTVYAHIFNTYTRTDACAHTHHIYAHRTHARKNTTHIRAQSQSSCTYIHMYTP